MHEHVPHTTKEQEVVTIEEGRVQREGGEAEGTCQLNFELVKIGQRCSRIRNENKTNLK